MTSAIMQEREQTAPWMPQVRAGHVWLAAGLLLIAWYLAGPLMTVWRIEQAIRQADAVALQTRIDWDSVRHGLKEDVMEGLLGLPQQNASAGDTLPPFGAGFMSGIAGSAIERDVTPQSLLAAARLLDSGGSVGIGMLRHSLCGAAFVAPDTFDLRLLAPGMGTDEQPLHVRLQFRDWQWRVVRVWIPQDLMDETAARS